MSIQRPLPPKGSLRRRIALLGIMSIALAGGALVVILVLGRAAQTELFAATDEFVEEQAIADRISQAVMEQLLAVSAIQAGAGSTSEAAFLEAGDRAYALFRRYLSRDLTTPERLQLERVKEEQQRLEVAAIRATTRYREGDFEAGDAGFEAMVTHGSDLLGAVAGFLDMRESGLHALRARQERTFHVASIAGLGLAVLLLLGSLVVGRLIQRRVADPLATLNEAVDRIATGDLDARVPDAQDEEFATLGRKFNHMAESLRELRSDLERRNTELANALERMREARAELLKSEKLSTVGRMTAGLVHELNNPLASILGYAELLEAELEDEGSAPVATLRDDFVMPIAEEARRAHHLIRNLLVFSRRAESTVAPMPLGSALDVAIGLRSFEFESAGLSLTVEDIPDSHVHAERQRLQETFLNLINNALYALRAGGGTGLRIHGREEKDAVVLLFDDDGPGFEQPDSALEPFVTTKPPEEGTGLGLALVGRYMDEFSGSVRVENRPERGARVELRFRIVEAPAVAEPPDPGDRSTHSAPTRAVGPEPHAGDSGPVVLIVEDEAHLRVIHERLLRRIGATPLLAGSVAEARRILAAEEVDLVISDVKMPGEGGVDLYHWIARERPHLAEHFLFVTGDTGSPETLDLFETNPAMFLRKPFEIGEYMERVKTRMPCLELME